MRANGIKKTFLELQGLGLLVSQLSDYSACFMCCIRLLLVYPLGYVEEKKSLFRGSFYTYFTLACSSSEMYNAAGSLYFEEKLLRIKITNMAGKCVT